MKTPAQLQVQMYHVFITKDMVAILQDQESDHFH